MFWALIAAAGCRRYVGSRRSGNLTDCEHKRGILPLNWSCQLPTIEQWEYASRAETTSRFNFGENDALVQSI